MGRTSREVWKKQVERWRASDLTAKEFAAEIGVNPGTLTHWKWQLGWEARGKPSAKAKSSKPKRRATARRRTKKEQVNFTEVTVTPEPTRIPIEIVTETGVRIRVSEAFDESTLRRVLEVVGVGA